MQRLPQAALRPAHDGPGPPIALTARAALLLALLTSAACTSGQDVPAPPPAAVEGDSSEAPGVACATPAALAAAAAAAARPPVALPPDAVLTDVTEQAGQRLVTGRVDTDVEQVLEHFRTARGYVVTRDEDEGRSGRLQLFGADGDVTVVVARLTCPRGATGFTVATSAAGRQASPGG